MVPVNRNRAVLGRSLLNIDSRGNEYLLRPRESMSDAELFTLNGNSWGEPYGATKLMWLNDHDPELYERTDWFLHWGSFVSFMLGTEPRVDYSLANRTLFFDLNRNGWSPELIKLCGLDQARIPETVPSGTVIGSVSKDAAKAHGVPAGTSIVSGAHDQCANATGCGAIYDGTALCGMGAFPTIAPVYSMPRPPEAMLALGLNTEHHAAPGLFVSFIFHMGGSFVKWYRDLPSGPSGGEGRASYDELFAGLTERSSVLQAIVEGNACALDLVFDRLPEAEIEPESTRAKRSHTARRSN